VEGVKKAEADNTTGKAEVTIKGKVDRDTLINAVKEVGFEAS
jgi:copper chaperone CopZ